MNARPKNQSKAWWVLFFNSSNCNLEDENIGRDASATETRIHT